MHNTQTRATESGLVTARRSEGGHSRTDATRGRKRPLWSCARDSPRQLMSSCWLPLRKGAQEWAVQRTGGPSSRNNIFLPQQTRPGRHKTPRRALSPAPGGGGARSFPCSASASTGPALATWASAAQLPTLAGTAVQRWSHQHHTDGSPQLSKARDPSS